MLVESRDWSDGDEEEPSFSAFVFESNTEGEKVRATAERSFQRETRQLVLHKWILKYVHLFLFTDLLHHQPGKGNHRS